MGGVREGDRGGRGRGGRKGERGTGEGGGEGEEGGKRKEERERGEIEGETGRGREKKEQVKIESITTRHWFKLLIIPRNSTTISDKLKSFSEHLLHSSLDMTP